MDRDHQLVDAGSLHLAQAVGDARRCPPREERVDQGIRGNAIRRDREPGRIEHRGVGGRDQVHAERLASRREHGLAIVADDDRHVRDQRRAGPARRARAARELGQRLLEEVRDRAPGGDCTVGDLPASRNMRGRSAETESARASAARRARRTL
jgi:hypothetical protein